MSLGRCHYIQAYISHLLDKPGEALRQSFLLGPKFQLKPGRDRATCFVLEHDTDGLLNKCLEFTCASPCSCGLGDTLRNMY